jgi:hypothetical protein
MTLVMILIITLKMKRVMTVAIWAIIKESMTLRMRITTSFLHVDKDNIIV